MTGEVAVCRPEVSAEQQHNGGICRPGNRRIFRGGEAMATEVNAQMFWSQMEDAKVDLIFEEVQNVLITLKQKIKDRTATHDECCQALALVKHADIMDLLSLTNVVDAAVEEMQKCASLHPSENLENPEESLSLRTEATDLTKSKEEPAEMTKMSSKFTYRNHVCSKECLVKRPWDSYKGENPLILPILCHFQRRHAKTDFVSKSHDVMYKAPCGRSLRNFQDVQNYLFETECNFLFLDNFSFNTYVQVFRKSPKEKAFVFDFDISKGAETIPVSFCNNINHNQLPYFKYQKVSLPHGYLLSSFSGVFFDSCSCTDGCTDRTKCACLLLTGGSDCEVSVSPRKENSNGYNYKRLDEPIPSGIYECSLLCRCDKILCQNRLVQHGLQVRLQVFNAENKGWGVRCLDDIDKGTFVCTYAGRLMSRVESIQCKDNNKNEEKDIENEEKDIENSDRNLNLFSNKRKLDIVCSDSETEFFQSPKKEKSSHLKIRDQSNKIQKQAITRPKIRTSVLRSHQKQPENNNFSSDEDEKTCQKSIRKLTTAVVKGSSQQQEDMEVVNTGQSEAKTNCHKENLNSMSDLQSSTLIKLLDQESADKKEATGDKRLCLKKNSYLLNATMEGNVGRFLNHSCSPNLFAQSVFVETHNRNFPWVAFFTNRHVKAGTELTWDYGFHARDMPVIETACQCGSPKCRGKIL